MRSDWAPGGLARAMAAHCLLTGEVPATRGTQIAQAMALWCAYRRCARCRWRQLGACTCDEHCGRVRCLAGCSS